MYIEHLNDKTLNTLLDKILTDSVCVAADPKSIFKPTNVAYIPTISTIPISKVLYSGDATTVWFTDGTKTTVRCSADDRYDRETAVVYALVKRMFGKVGRVDPKTKRYIANEIDSNGLGTKLDKIVKNGIDQAKQKQTAAEAKAKAKSVHERKQKEAHAAAWQRKVKRRAEQMKLEREAAAYLDSLSKTTSKKVLTEDTTAKVKPSAFFKEQPTENTAYVRPDKPFSQFTQEEKREYWREQNCKRKN